MNNRLNLAAALALVTAQVSSPASAHEVDLTSILLQNCDRIDTMFDREELQAELLLLLAMDPNNDCIDLIVQKLGGSPVAQISADAY
jgi:hypothetical protein